MTANSSKSEQRPSLLYVTHRVPYPPNRGDRIRTYHILKYLAARCRVRLACLAEEPLEPGTWAALQELCAEVAVIPVQRRLRWVRGGLSFLAGRTVTEGAFRSPALQSAVRRWGGEHAIDLALVSSSALAPYLRVSELARTRRYVDLIDVDSQKWLDYAANTAGPRAAFYRQEGRRLRRLESQLADEVHGIFVVSEAEAELYRSFRPDGPIVAVSNGVDLDYFRPGPDPGGESCVFVGALDYPPNIDAACWFSQHVWPGIRERAPSAKLQLVGREPTRPVRELAAVPGVEVVGTVPDVRPFLTSAAVVVVPLRIARGVQNKVLEAMAAGKAVVCSPGPLSGLAAEPDRHLLCADTEGDWVNAVVRLLQTPSLRQELGTAAATFVGEQHRWERCLEPLANRLGLDQRVPSLSS